MNDLNIQSYIKTKYLVQQVKATFCRRSVYNYSRMYFAAYSILINIYIILLPQLQ